MTRDSISYTALISYLLSLILILSASTLYYVLDIRKSVYADLNVNTEIVVLAQKNCAIIKESKEYSKEEMDKMYTVCMVNFWNGSIVTTKELIKRGAKVRLVR